MHRIQEFHSSADDEEIQLEFWRAWNPTGIVVVSAARKLGRDSWEQARSPETNSPHTLRRTQHILMALSRSPPLTQTHQRLCVRPSHSNRPLTRSLAFQLEALAGWGEFLLETPTTLPRRTFHCFRLCTRPASLLNRIV